MTNTDLSEVPFIYDANEKVAVLRGTTGENAEIVFRLVERLDDDSHIAVVATSDAEGFKFNLAEDDIAFHEDEVVVTLPAVRLKLDPVYMRKFRAFTRGNYPTPDIAGVTLP